MSARGPPAAGRRGIRGARAASRRARPAGCPRPAPVRRRGRRRSAPPGRRARRRACPRRPTRGCPGRRPVSARRRAAVTDVAKCNEGMAARGLPPSKPYRGFQPEPQNCSPYSTIIRRSSGVSPSSIRPGARGVPRRRRRDGPVADQAEVERRVDVRRRAREPVAVAIEQEEDGAVREGEPDPVRPDQQLLPAAERPGAAERALQPQRRRLAAPDELVDLDRVGDAHAALERLRVVVGHLVRRDVGPHLQHACRDVARARARDEDAERERRRRGGRRHDGRRELEAAADERRRHAGGERRDRGRADGGRGAHGGGGA